MGQFVSGLREDEEISCQAHVYNLFNVAHTRCYKALSACPVLFVASDYQQHPHAVVGTISHFYRIAHKVESFPKVFHGIAVKLFTVNSRRYIP